MRLFISLINHSSILCLQFLTFGIERQYRRNKENYRRWLRYYSKDYEDGLTLLHLASPEGHHEDVQVLLSHGAKTSIADKQLDIPIHRAARNGHKKVVSMFFEAGTCLDIPGHNNMTALHPSAFHGHKECCELLISYSADVDARTQVNIYVLKPCFA